jgi:hypothetical protein
LPDDRLADRWKLLKIPFYKLLYPTESDRLAGYEGWYW